jgi:pyridoxal phosphate enzyme (YggS family)
MTSTGVLRVGDETMTSSPLQAFLTNRLQMVEQCLGAACRRAGRARVDVTLVCVTKTISVASAALLPELGVVHLGESRPQELWRKAAVLPGHIHWHLVGHLQRNKIERTLPLVHMIHSVDSVRLLEAMEQEAAKQERSVTVLLQINASREVNKHSFAPEDMPGFIPQLGRLQHARVAGLMTMAALEEDPQRSRPTFGLLRELRDRLRGDLPPPHTLEHLSMGMSNDFEVAVEEGATLVRIGTALFEGMPENGP